MLFNIEIKHYIRFYHNRNLEWRRTVCIIDQLESNSYDSQFI